MRRAALRAHHEHEEKLAHKMLERSMANGIAYLSPVDVVYDHQRSFNRMGL